MSESYIIPDRKIVIALGGNTIIKKGDSGDFHSQWSNTYRSLNPVVDLIEDGFDVVITHGNGPQVGALMMMVDKARDIIPETPLGVADAMTEGSMGYMLEQNLQNLMIKKGIRKNVVAIPVQMVVDRKDPSLSHPAKPIGRFYTEEEAAEMAEKKQLDRKERFRKGLEKICGLPLSS